VMAKASLPAERIAAHQVPTAAAVAAKTAPVVAFKAAKANVRRPFMSPRVASTRVSVAAAR
jgi:hypothetical protein